MTTHQRKQDLENRISKISGIDTELTIRGEREFTISCEGDHVALMEQTAQKIGGTVDSTEYDPECDYTSCFFHG